MVRILVVDDQEIMRKVVRTLLEEQTDWVVCGEAGDGKEAIEKTQLLKPDLIVLDIQMPFMNGLVATREIMTLDTPPYILILSVGEPSHFGKAAERCGAKGYLEKSQTTDHLVTAVSTLLRNEKYYPQLSPDRR